MLFGKTKKLLEAKESEVRLNLSNNYKDAAFKAYEEWKELADSLKANGSLSEKDYEKVCKKIDELAPKFKSLRR